MGYIGSYWGYIMVTRKQDSLRLVVVVMLAGTITDLAECSNSQSLSDDDDISTPGTSHSTIARVSECICKIPDYAIITPFE